MASKLKTQEVILQSPNGLQESTLSLSDSGVVSSTKSLTLASPILSGTATASQLNIQNSLSFGNLSYDYSNAINLTSDAVSGTWFTLIPVGALALGSYFVDIYWNYNGQGSAPYYMGGATIIKTVSSNGAGGGNVVILPTATHVPGTGYYLAIRNLMGTGQIESGLDVQLNGATFASGSYIRVYVKKIFS